MIVITGGGTGGHLSIAKSIAIQYNNLGVKPIYIGSTKGQDISWFKNSPFFSQTIFLDSYGVVNQSFFGKIKSFINILKLSLHVKKILKENNVKKVFSVGGYSSAATSIAAVLSKTPLFIHEQNAVMGKLNTLLKPYAKEIFCSFDSNSSVKDYPVDSSWFQIRKEHESIKCIAFLGGSQGASFINNLAMNSAQWLSKNNIKIVHQAGNKEFKKVQKFYLQNNIDADIFEFYSPLSEKLKNVDLAISRSGAGSVWELCAAKIPTVFIPYPFAAKDHQYFNSKALEDKNACLVKREKDINSNSLIDIITTINVKSLSNALDGLIKEDGAKNIVEIIESY